MGELEQQRHQSSRITCQVHHRLSPRVSEELIQLGTTSVLLESGRSVRQLRRPRAFGLPGKLVRLIDQPVDIFRVTVPRDQVEAVTRRLIATADLGQPGRGTIYSQDLVEYCRVAPSAEAKDSGNGPAETPGFTSGDNVDEPGRREQPVAVTLLKELAAITCILSIAGGGEQLARVALDLGTCVPVVTFGTGTGMRDRLGLLRITVPPEKEIVHLLVPSHDAEGIIRILIDEGNLNQPGRGFVYQTPVSAGLLDTRLRIGPQEHAASIEQIIAAVDELKATTTWRKRFVGIEGDETDAKLRLLRNNREITVICAEGRAGELVDAALEAGAGGATISRVRRLSRSDPDGGIAARERSTISVSAEICDRVVAALLEIESHSEDGADRIQVLESPAAFTHHG